MPFFIILIVLISLLFIQHGIHQSKIDEYDVIIEDLIHYMSLDDYNSFVDWANYTRNGKSRYKWRTFNRMNQKRTFKNEKK